MVILRMSPDDPRAIEVANELDEFQDHVGQMSSEDRIRYKDKVLAILCRTGKIIAAEDTIDELRTAVMESVHSDMDWRLVDGPTSKNPMTIDELKRTLK